MWKTFFFVSYLFVFGLLVHAQTERDFVSTREMERINWMEFKDVVPSKITTVILPTGTLEPHGVINNGADNTLHSRWQKRSHAGQTR
jgi:creatinine amidohydrolase